MTWQLTDAKARFSELFEQALAEGPQEITRRGKDRVYMLSAEDYERLAGKRPGFKELLFQEGPSFEGLDLSRDPDPGREDPAL